MSDTSPSGVAGARNRRLSDVRFIGAIAGRYKLISRTGRSSAVQVFACRTQSFSPQQAVLNAPVAGDRGETVVAHFEDVGLVRAKVSRAIDHGFAMEIDASPEEKLKIGARIDWIKRKTLNAIADKREHKRILPRVPTTTLILPNGNSIEGFIIDMSRSGVAISADIYPEIGLPLAVGSLVGRVVRHLEVGFAVQFLALQEPESLESSLTRHILRQLQDDEEAMGVT